MPYRRVSISPYARNCKNKNHQPSKDGLEPGLYVHECPACQWTSMIAVHAEDEL